MSKKLLTLLMAGVLAVSTSVGALALGGQRIQNRLCREYLIRKHPKQ